MGASRVNTTVTQVFLDSAMFEQIRALRADHGITQRVFFDVAAREALAKPSEQWAEIARRHAPVPKTLADAARALAEARAEIESLKAALPPTPSTPVHNRAAMDKEIESCRREIHALMVMETENGYLNLDQQQRMSEARMELSELLTVYRSVEKEGGFQ